MCGDFITFPRSEAYAEVDVIIHFFEALGRVLRKVLLLGRDLTCRMPLFVTSQLFNLWFVNTPQHALYVALVLAVDNCQQGYVISLIYSPLRILHLRSIQILGTHWSWRKVTLRKRKFGDEEDFLLISFSARVALKRRSWIQSKCISCANLGSFSIWNHWKDPNIISMEYLTKGLKMMLIKLAYWMLVVHHALKDNHQFYEPKQHLIR